MGKAGFDYKEIRVVIEKELTQVYVLLEAWGDSPIGVQGWHHKTFGASKPVEQIIHDFVTDDPVMWPQKAPGE